MPQLSLNKIIPYAKHLGVYFGASLIPMLLSLVSNPFIAKNMSPEDYAISGYYTSFSSLISPIIWFYLVHYFIKEFFRKEAEERRMLVAVIAKSLIWFSGLMALLCLGTLYVYMAFIKSNHDFPIFPYLTLMVATIPLQGLYCLRLAEDRIQKKSTEFFKLSVVNGVLNVVMSVILVVFLKWGAFGKLLAPLTVAAAIFVYMLYEYRNILRIKVEFRQYTPVIKFCFPLALSAALGYFTNGFSTTYLESLNQTTQYGIYIVGVSIGHYLLTFSTAINNTFQPDLYETVVKKQWRRYAFFVVVQLALIGFITALFIMLAPYIIDILTAGRYTDSTPYAQIVAISTFTSTMYFIVNNFSIVTNHPQLYLYTTILGSLFIVLAMPWFVARWSFAGGAWLGVVSYVVFAAINIILLVFVKKLPKKVAQ